MKVLFLYTELADYTLSCLKALKNNGHDIKVIHYPVNPEAPFKFIFDNIGVFNCILDYKTFRQLRDDVKIFSPDIIICSGWLNKNYLRICYEYRRKSTCVLTMDNHWDGTFKQKILSYFSKITIQKIFKFCWIPGDAQLEYAIKLGFNTSNIKRGFYSCDFLKFNSIYHGRLQKISSEFPKVFLCVARYVPQKNYEMLWSAFIKWQERMPSEWELWCAGTGPDWDQRVIHPKIKHLGFIQPDNFQEILFKSGVFVLASSSEPWGVVVHEFAASGFPLVLSTEIGAAAQFTNGKNGLLFEPNDVEQLICSFDLINSLTNSQLIQMGIESNDIAQGITPEIWAETISLMGNMPVERPMFVGEI